MSAGLRTAGLCLAESVDGRGELRPEEVDAVLRCPAILLVNYLAAQRSEPDRPLTLNNPPSAEPLPRKPFAWFGCVDTEDIEDVSESLPAVIELIRLDAVELVLFFFGTGGSTLPGNSVRSLLCRRLKSPYRRPMKYSSSPFRLTRRMNSCRRVRAANKCHTNRKALTACLWYLMFRLIAVTRTPATLTSQPFK